MNLFRLKYLVQATVNGVMHKKAVFEAVQTDDAGNPKFDASTGRRTHVPVLAADGKPLVASMLLGLWQNGTRLRKAIVHAGGQMIEAAGVDIAIAGQYNEPRQLENGTMAASIALIGGLYPYVKAECVEAIDARDGSPTKGKPLTGKDGRIVRDIAQVPAPEWHVWMNTTGVEDVPPASAPAAATAPLSE